jgi:cytochrome c-type biogenesis protein
VNLAAVFNTLTAMVESAGALAVAAAFLWGVMSVALSPCHVATVPLVVGFVNAGQRPSAARAFKLSLSFSVGILASLAVVGVLTAATGRLLGDTGVVARYAVAAVLVLCGILLLDVLPASLLPALAQPAVRFRGAGGAALLGGIFGIALGPCSFAFLAPLIAISFSSSAARPGFAAALFGAYGVGHCLLIVLAGTFAGALRSYLRWSDSSPAVIWIRRACGVIVIAAGVALVL